MEKKLSGKTDKTENKQKKRGAPPEFLFKKGQSGNPDGRPVGALSFSTKWFAFMERIAKENGVSVSELDHKMMTVAFKQMQEGKFPYWKDVNDRLYGQANQHMEVGGNLIVRVDGSLDSKYAITSKPKNNSRGHS